MGCIFWRAWQDSNLQPLGSKPSTLSIELQAHYSEGVLMGRAMGFEPTISCATDRRLRPLGYARHKSPKLNLGSRYVSKNVSRVQAVQLG